MKYAYKNGKILNGTKEMHVHLAGNGKPQKKQRDNAKLVKTLMSNRISRAIAYRMVAGFAKDELLSGVTTIRTVGGLGTFDTRLRDEIKAGKITQNMFDALVSLAYNIGTGALAGSSIIRKLKAGDKLGAANAFRLYNKSGGQVLKGLVNRREEERKIFLS